MNTPVNKFAGETIAPLAEAAKTVLDHNCRKISIALLHRWVHKGKKGHQLEAIRVKGTIYTSTGAVQRFITITHD